MLHLDLNRFFSVILTIFAISLILTAGLITGCSDEGDSVTEMVADDDEKMDVVDPVDPDPPDPVDPPEGPTVSFKDDISPILTASCAFVGCHVAGHVTDLDLSSYDTFKDGGNRGPAFVEGDGKESLVVKYIEGRVEPQMPINGVPLNGEQIQLFIDWINEGAENN